MAGYVYAIENSDKKIKIGKTTNTKRRFGEIERQSGTVIVHKYVSPLVRYYSKLESDVLNHFKDFRLNGEWFSCDFDSVKSFVNSLNLSEYMLTNEVDDDPTDDKKMSASVMSIILLLRENNSNRKLVEDLALLLSSDIDVLLNRIDVLEDKLMAYEESGVHVDYPKKDIESDSQKKMAEMFERHAKLFG